jgi:cysteine synthase A
MRYAGSLESVGRTPVIRPHRLAAKGVGLDPEAKAFVSRVVADESQPVVLFLLVWCEFCWSVRTLFDRLWVGYRTVNLDSIEYRAGDRGDKIRAALMARVGAPAIPQIFVAGEHVGGAADVFDAFKSGRLQELLQHAGVAFNPNPGLDPYSLLPNWRHPCMRA